MHVYHVSPPPRSSSPLTTVSRPVLDNYPFGRCMARQHNQEGTGGTRVHHASALRSKVYGTVLLYMKKHKASLGACPQLQSKTSETTYLLLLLLSRCTHHSDEAAFIARKGGKPRDSHAKQNKWCGGSPANSLSFSRSYARFFPPRPFLNAVPLSARQAPSKRTP